MRPLNTLPQDVIKYTLILMNFADKYQLIYIG
jgi:hypothetical protein